MEIKLVVATTYTSTYYTHVRIIRNEICGTAIQNKKTVLLWECCKSTVLSNSAVIGIGYKQITSKHITSVHARLTDLILFLQLLTWNPWQKNSFNREDIDTNYH